MDYKKSMHMYVVRWKDIQTKYYGSKVYKTVIKFIIWGFFIWNFHQKLFLFHLYWRLPETRKDQFVFFSFKPFNLFCNFCKCLYLCFLGRWDAGLCTMSLFLLLLDPVTLRDHENRDGPFTFSHIKALFMLLWPKAVFRHYKSLKEKTMFFQCCPINIWQSWANTHKNDGHPEVTSVLQSLILIP